MPQTYRYRKEVVSLRKGFVFKHVKRTLGHTTHPKPILSLLGLRETTAGTERTLLAREKSSDKSSSVTNTPKFPTKQTVSISTSGKGVISYLTASSGKDGGMKLLSSSTKERYRHVVDDVWCCLAPFLFWMHLFPNALKYGYMKELLESNTRAVAVSNNVLVRSMILFYV